MDDLKTRLLKVCKFTPDNPYSGGYEVFERCVASGNIAARCENARLMPILKALIDIAVESQAALEWNAGTICLGDIYDKESNEQNKINLLRNIREAHDALAKNQARLDKILGEKK